MEFLTRLSEDFRDVNIEATVRAVAVSTPPAGTRQHIAQTSINLNRASYFGHAGLAAMHLDAGVNPNFTLDNGAFPLLMAAQAGHHETVSRLLKHPDINVN